MIALIYLLFIAVLRCDDNSTSNPHDAYNQAQIQLYEHDKEVILAKELMDLLISRGALCAHTDTYVSTFRWPSLEAISKLVYVMKNRGWRLSLEEINVSDNVQEGQKVGTYLAICRSRKPLFIRDRHVCALSFTYDRSIETHFISDSYKYYSRWNDGDKNGCPKRIQVIHFRHQNE